MRTENFFVSRFLIFVFVVSAMFVSSCTDDDSDDGDDKPITKEMSIALGADQEVPPVFNRTESGTSNIKIYMDTTLAFNITVNNVKSGDQLTVAHIHVGGPVETGSPIVVLVDNNKIKFSGNKASGTIELTTEQFNQLKGDGDFYVNVHSVQLPDGISRGQLNKSFRFVSNVNLTPLANPSRPETGTAIFRLTNDSVLHYKITVNNLLSSDALTSANIHMGAAGGSGDVVIPLITGSTGFGVARTLKLTASQVNSLLNSQVYVNVKSNQLAVELLRGQIR